MNRNFDAIIIGAGAVGCAVARELSRYDLRIAVLEKNSDVAGETTGRNSAVVHAGFNNRPGSMMAGFCVEGNEGFEALCRNLDVPYRRTGKLLAAFDDEDVQTLEHLLAQGRANGCRDLRILEHEELGAFLREHGMEKTLETGGAAGSRTAADGTAGSQTDAGSAWLKALWSPHTGITNPFLYCVALAENAQANGVTFCLNTKVTGIRREERCIAGKAAEETAAGPGNQPIRRETHFIVETKDGTGQNAAGDVFRCRYLINCAGLQADRIAAMAGVDKYRIYPCRGEYFILDKPAVGAALETLPMPIYPAPRKHSGGLGVHLTPTIEGNVLIGPSAEYLEDIAAGNADPAERREGGADSAREDYACTRPVMGELMQQALQLMPRVAKMQPIGNYSGIRPKLTPPGEGGYHDFVIQAEEDVPGLIDLIGIESPGLTASVPIARKVCRMIAEMERGGIDSAAQMANDVAATGDPKKADGTQPEGGLRRKKGFCGTRQGILRFREQSPKRQAELIAADSDYGEIICRCQKITKREIRQAIENPLGARSLAAIKYRAWATTGRCNGGYCLPRIASILTEEYGLAPEEIRYRDPGSEMFTGRVK